MKNRTILSSLLVLFSFASIGLGQGKKEEQEIRKVVQDACKSLKARDVNALMKTTAVPFCVDLVKVVDDEKRLRSLLKTVFAGPSFQGAQVKFFKITGIKSYKEYRTQYSKAQRDIADRVLTKDGWIVLVHCPTPNKTEEGFALLLGRRNGKLKVVGLAD